MNWQTTTFLAVLLFLMALPWHLPDAVNPINPTPKSILLTGVANLCQHCRSSFLRRFNPKPQLAAAEMCIRDRSYPTRRGARWRVLFFLVASNPHM